MSGYRLPAPLGRRIDRSRLVTFLFNGRAYSGFYGDTLAAALLANGVRLVGRSFKLHRPRGIFSCGIEEPTAIVDVGEGARRTPNQRATLVELSEGLIAESVNCWPSVELDLGAVNRWLAPLLPAGFYYKTFKWPSWGWFEPVIRRMAGLGRAPTKPDPDRYEEVSVATDILVVGAGIAGLSAAVAAAHSGARTMLLTSSAELGGALGWRADPEIDELRSSARRLGVQIQTRTLAFGVYDHNLVCATELLAADAPSPGARGVLRERLWRIRARSVCSAQGSFERPLLFPDNDRPGVMLAGAADKFAHAYGVAGGRRVVIMANSDSAYAVAASLRSAGIEVVALLDRRPSADIAADAGNLRVMTNTAIEKVIGTAAVRACVAGTADGRGARPERIDCDLILSAGGHAPAVHLHSQAGGKLRWVDESAMFVPDGAAPGLFSVGACAGVFSRDAAALHASEVGRALAHGFTVPAAPVGGAGRTLASSRVAAARGKQFVDLQNDVTVDDVGLAALENYRAVEHLKRYTTTGMATDQGKTSNVNALVLMAEMTQRDPPQVGTTKFRPPFAPVTFGALVGRRVGALYRPLKQLPAARWHAAHGALFEQFGRWSRPAAYPLGPETLHAAAQREAAAVRRSVGLFDGSPLGKLEIWGADAAQFLDLMYVGNMSTLAVGQARYGLLLDENGVVVDDGIVARLGERHFWVNTTSAGIERTAAAFEEWLQCEFTNLKVLVTPVTSRWGNVTVAGPKAWSLMAAAGFDAAFSPATMRHMTIRDGTLDEAPLRILRASFSGELAYEINLPADATVALFERLLTAGAALDALLYGVEALEIMRTEKGYIHIGTDTDGTTLPGDIGFARALERKAANFVGRRSLTRPAALDARRLQLVALSPLDRRTLLPTGAQIAADAPPATTEGHVTSSYWSPELNAPVALGMLSRGSGRLGERVSVHHLGARIEAEVVKAPFIDPAGERLRG
ncbi:MAG TPA: 2Fe-2S iron-sulfur cluster-binding protein [Steroidobacteraceae bacterium]|nr:2Fe-2S iron-sulfur cluster-binding protein [Steroidobacteraceae bacterium]